MQRDSITDKEQQSTNDGSGPCRSLDVDQIASSGSTNDTVQRLSPTARPFDGPSHVIARRLLSGLGWLDKLLTPLIILAMILGVVIGRFAPDVKRDLNRGQLQGVAAPLVVGLIVMMWPILTKVRCIHALTPTHRLMVHLFLGPL
jgi:ACR3 family arsenite transporter